MLPTETSEENVSQTQKDMNAGSEAVGMPTHYRRSHLNSISQHGSPDGSETDEKPRCYNQLVSLTTSMAGNVIPGCLPDLGQEGLGNLMQSTQEVNNSLKIFIELCVAISQKGPSPPRWSLGQNTNMIRVVDLEKSLIPQKSLDGVRKSCIHVSVTYNDAVWKKLLADARELHLACPKPWMPSLYYCGACNIPAEATDVWLAHLSDAAHLKMLETVQTFQFSCNKCSLRVISDCALFSTIMASDEHLAFEKVLPVPSGVPASPGRLVWYVQPKPQQAEVAEKTNVAYRNLQVPPPPPLTYAEVLLQTPKPRIQRPPKVVPKKQKSEKVIFLKIEIHLDFVKLSEKIASFMFNNELFSIGYCRPCEAVCLSESQWNAHEKTRNHMYKMSLKRYRNVLCSCLQCNFVITAGPSIAICYMKYHIEHVHHHSTRRGTIYKYMKVESLLESEKVEKKQLRKRANQTVAIKKHARAGLPLGSSLDDDSRADASSSAQSASTARSSQSTFTKNIATSNLGNQTTSASDPGQLPAKNDPLSARPENFSGQDELEVMFLEMLTRKVDSFKANKSVIFSALCTVCKIAFSDESAWDLHVISHDEPDDEVECLGCNACFFGDPEHIRAAFIEHDYHACVDSILRVK